MYFVQYIYEVVGDYSVTKELGTVILDKLSSDIDGIIYEVSLKTERSVVGIKEIQFIDN
ncbi:hypothetical protein [Ilyobacter polytropus]|uniref:Uncharacterized protein n=1 Tax=Ilyobacter polytropus (strain ATCC 51220 / DSM 2926 / LMG 16218 / CuHBu1) TaxID=572544 RepID=E3H6Q6_ILYPC|nr:hypothetical protein [Ilyobacter polytropus]ADO82425.1 hypothetical protein Ilyop_0638 [Ilyobacter polytropus DSM 2926]